MVKGLQAIVLTGMVFAAASAFGATKSYELNDIEGLRAAGNTDVFIAVGTEQSVQITAADDVFPHLEVKEEGGRLVIKKDEGWFFNKCPRDCRIKVELTVKSLKDVRLAGSTNLVAKGIRGEEFSIQLAGSAQARLEGAVTRLKVKTAGSAEVQALKLIADKVSIKSAGSSDIQVHAEKELKAQVAGSGNVSYTGEPAVVQQKVAGSGSVNKRRGSVF